MIRRLFTLVTMVSFLLALVTAALWIRTYGHIWYVRDWGGMSNHHLILVWRGDITYEQFPPPPVVFATQTWPPSRYYAIRLSMLTAAFCLLPLWWIARLAIRRRMQGMRAGRELCVECGYDLRASSNRCPECGTAIPEESEA